MPFFVRSKEGKKPRKRKDNANASNTQSKVKKQRNGNDEEIASDSDLDSNIDDYDDRKQNEDSSSSEEETAQEKRLRLAKQYLAQLETEEASDDEEVDRDVISQKLKQQFLEQSGKLQKDIAQYYSPPCAEDICSLRGHQLSVTCLVITPDDKCAFSASKDCSIIKWDICKMKKLQTIPGGRKGTEDTHIGHTDHILSMAISTDNKFLVSGDKNKLIYVWNPETCQRLKVLKGHRDSISGLAFRKVSHQLFSSSHDRTVKIWNLDEMAYIETLFGHQDLITGVDSLTRERAVTCGGRDGSIRIWKVIEESQLVFHGHSGSIDCVSLINEEHFVSGADDNSLALWSIMKKKPLCCIRNAHPGPETVAGKKEHWITSVVSLQYTDLIASGSQDGCVRLWKCSPDFKSLTLLFSIPVRGFVNSIKFSTDGLKMVIGVGKEHKLGRWWSMKDAKNSLQIITLSRKSEGAKNNMKQNIRIKSAVDRTEILASDEP